MVWLERLLNCRFDQSGKLKNWDRSISLICSLALAAAIGIRRAGVLRRGGSLDEASEALHAVFRIRFLSEIGSDWGLCPFVEWGIVKSGTGRSLAVDTL